MPKIKELLLHREKLIKYDELSEWKELFSDDTVNVYIDSVYFDFSDNCSLKNIPDNIKRIIVSALEAEIKQLDKE